MRNCGHRFELQVWRSVQQSTREVDMDPTYECDAPRFVDFELLKQGLADDEDVDMWFGESRYVGSNSSSHVSIWHEYMLVYAFQRARVITVDCFQQRRLSLRERRRLQMPVKKRTLLFLRTSLRRNRPMQSPNLLLISITSLRSLKKLNYKRNSKEHGKGTCHLQRTSLDKHNDFDGKKYWIKHLSLYAIINQWSSYELYADIRPDQFNLISTCFGIPDSSCSVKKWSV